MTRCYYLQGATNFTKTELKDVLVSDQLDIPVSSIAVFSEHGCHVLMLPPYSRQKTNMPEKSLNIY